MSGKTTVSQSDTIDFDLGTDQMSEVEQSLSQLTDHEQRFLHHLVHEPDVLDARVLPDEVPEPYRGAVESLLEAGLLIREENDTVRVPESVQYHPSGPGVRRDQLSGVLHRLPEESVRQWYGMLGEEGGDETEDWLIYRRLMREITDRRKDLDPLVPPDWTATQLQQSPAVLKWDDPVPIEDFYQRLEETSSDLKPYFFAGVLLPSWDEDGTVRAVLLENTFRRTVEDSEWTGSQRATGREVEWERKPFSPAEQLKFLLIAADAVPFRLTREDEPHRFDLKEVARVSEWSTEHLEYLTFLLIENGFLEARDERFFMNHRAQQWDNGDRSLNPFLSGHGTTRLTPGEDTPGTTPDLSAGRTLRAALRLLVEAETEAPRDELTNRLRDHPAFHSMLMVLPEDGGAPEGRLEDLAEGVLETLFAFGMLDRLEEDESVFYRSNERGDQLLDSEELRGPEHEELPYILQPDGQLLVPLESPLRAFRRINPFALLVKADRMIGYQIDRQSLVQALNEGWDATGFRTFLEEKTESVPEPLEDLFEETIGNVKEIDIEKVHHLIRFEDGATAAKAANILNNYDPMRIDETTLVLGSETSSETIRRNLSRGGIRLSGGDMDSKMSPLLEDPEN